MVKLARLVVVLAMAAVFIVILVLPASAAAFTVCNMSNSGVAFPATVGSPVTITGLGSVPGAGKAIIVYLARSPGAKSWTIPQDVGDVVAVATSDSAGAWGTSFLVPELRSSSPSGGPVANGVYDVFLMSGADSYTFTGPNGLNIKPNIRCSPASAAPGTLVTLQGTGFAGNETGITAVFDTAGINATIATGITATSRGSWTASFRIPDRPAGTSLIISATGTNTTGIGTPTTTFEVTRGLRLIPDKASPGTTVTTLSRGFAASTAMTFKLDAATLTTTPASPSTTADGRVIASFVVPPGTSYGPHKITATDAAGGIYTEQLTVTRPTYINLNPASGIPGDMITITGGGFNSLAFMNFYLGISNLTLASPAVITGADGSFTASVKILDPMVHGYVPGFYSLVATDMCGESASAIFTILNPHTR